MDKTETAIPLKVLPVDCPPGSVVTSITADGTSAGCVYLTGARAEPIHSGFTPDPVMLLVFILGILLGAVGFFLLNSPAPKIPK